MLGSPGSLGGEKMWRNASEELFGGVEINFGEMPVVMKSLRLE